MKKFHNNRKLRSLQTAVRSRVAEEERKYEKVASDAVAVRQTGKSTMYSSYMYFTQYRLYSDSFTYVNVKNSIRHQIVKILPKIPVLA